MVDPHTVKVIIELDKVGLLYATSPNMKGLLVARKDYTELLNDVPKAIKLLHEAKGEDVSVYSVTEGQDLLYFVTPNWEDKLNKLKKIYDLDLEEGTGSSHARHNLQSVVYEVEHKDRGQLDEIQLKTLNRVIGQLADIEKILEGK